MRASAGPDHAGQQVREDAERATETMPSSTWGAGGGEHAMLVFWLLCGRGLGVDTLSGQEGCLHWSQ